MGKRILITGSGLNAASVVRKARAIGLYTIAVDDNPDAACLRAAHEARTGNYLDIGELARIARDCRVDGIAPAPEPAVVAVARACAELGLPGAGAASAALTRNKAAMREAFHARGIANPPFRTAHTVEEALAAGRELGMPVVLKPADSFAGIDVRQVDHIEDLPLAFAQAARSSFIKTLVVESFVRGEVIAVDGYVSDGEFVACGFLAKERCAPPSCFDIGVSAPAALDANARDDLRRTAAAAVKAIGFGHGCTHVEILCSREGPLYPIEVSAYPAGIRLPRDVIALAGDMDLVANALRLAVGDAPKGTLTWKRAAALYWIPTHSGIVTDLRGVDEARRLPGVEEIVLSVKPGDVLGHIVDCPTRDRIGYVLATSETTDLAVQAAKRARDRCEILTRPMY
jgi:biotin carboxylase